MKQRDIDKAIDELGLDDLVGVQARVTQLISQQKRSKKADLLREFQEIAGRYGLVVHSVVWGDEGQPGRRRKLSPKSAGTSQRLYRHPENPRLTWGGRGRKPGWLQEFVDQGRDVEEFRVS